MRWQLGSVCLAMVGIGALVSLDARQGTAPLPPTLLPASVVSSSVNLAWIPNGSGPAATAYQLHAGSGPGLSDLAIANLPNQTTFAAIAPPGTYYVRIVAINGAGASVASNEIIVLVTGGGGCVPPGIPTGLAATVVGGIVTLTWNTAATGGAPTGHLLYVGSTAGVVNIGTFAVGPSTTLVSPAPPGQYFVRVAASNACGTSASSGATGFIIGGGTSSLGAGVYVGQMFNHSRFGLPPITSFTLQLNQPVPAGSAFQLLSARWTDNRGCVKTTGIFGATTTTGPLVSIEGLACNDGDLGLRVTSVNGNVYSGVCPLGGASCTFQMTRQ